MIVCSGSVRLKIFYHMFCCLVRLVADIFMGCVCFHCRQVCFHFFFFPFPFVITAKPEPFVALHFEQLLFSSPYAHTHTHTHRHLFTHTCHTHFIASFTALVCIGSRATKWIKTTLRKAQCQYFTLNSLKELCIRFWLVLIRRCYPWLIPCRNNSFFVWRGRRVRQEERWTEINPACDTPRHSVIIPSTSHTGSLTVYTVFWLCLLAQGNVYFYGNEPEVGINKLTIWLSCSKLV